MREVYARVVAIKMAELDKKTLVRKGQRLIAQKRLTEVDQVLDGTQSQIR